MAVPDAANSTESDAKSSVLKDITSFKNFNKTVEKKLSDLEKVIIFQQKSLNSIIYNVGTDDENGKSDFIFDLIKNRIVVWKIRFAKKMQ